MDILAKFETRQVTRTVPEFKSGDMVKVHYKIKEGNKERIQIFEGLVLARKHGKGINATFTVRKVASGVGVEKVYPLYSPFIDKIEIVKRMKTRQSKLYYLRTAKGKRARLKEIRDTKSGGKKTMKKNIKKETVVLSTQEKENDSKEQNAK